MSSERQGGVQRERELFQEILDQAPEARASFLAEACAGDEGLRARLLDLLAAHGRAGGFLEVPAAIDSEDTGGKPAGEPPRIGRYRILRRVATGGMGVIYEAEQESPHRTVALKVLRPGLLPPTALHRFRHEAEILGRLHHPGIAQIYEAGSEGALTEDGEGVPFFAMEWIDGLPLTEHAERNRLDLRGRVGLLLKVCEAVQYAHTSGVLHRDLKPDNVLVDAAGHPRVLDFGVARATNQDLQATTFHTEVGQIIGTLPYMSPEQIAGRPDLVDERSDVYSLGVVAYELFTGRLPYDLRDQPLPEALRILAEEDPTPASASNQQCRGDLETIVGKALEKERERRYASVQKLAADLRRFLEHRPVVARPAGTWYHLRKFARRNKVLVASVVVVFLALVAGIVGIGTGLVRARAEAARTRAVSEFLRRTLASGNPTAFLWGRCKEPGGPNVTVAHLLKVAVQELNEVSTDPEVEALQRLAIGEAYFGLGLLEDAEEQLRKSLGLLERCFGDRDPRVAETLSLLGQIVDLRDRSLEGESLHRRAIAIFERVLGPLHRVTLTARRDLGWNLCLSSLEFGSKLKEAEEFLREIVPVQRRVLGNEDLVTLGSSARLAHVLSVQQNFAESRPLIEETVAICRRRFGPEHIATAFAEMFLGESLDREGKPADALAMFEGIYRVYLREAGEQNRYTLWADRRVAHSLVRVGRLREAEVRFRRALYGRKQLTGWSSRATFEAITGYAGLLERQGRKKEAEELLLEGLAGARRTSGEEHPFALEVWCRLANLVAGAGRDGEAESLFRTTLERTRLRFGWAHARSVGVAESFASFLGKKRRWKEYEALLRESLAGCRQDGRAGWMLLRLLGPLGWILLLEGRPEEAVRIKREGLDVSRSQLGPRSLTTAGAMNELAWTLKDLGDLDGAEGLAREARQIYAGASVSRDSRTTHATCTLAVVLRMRGRLDEAEPLQRAALADARVVFGEKSQKTGSFQCHLGELLTAMKRFEEAEKEIQDGVRILEALSGVHPSFLRKAREAQVCLYETWGKPEQAAAARARL